MRQIGTLSSEDQAQRFVDYLVTCSMDAHAELEGENWEIWVRDEDHVEQAVEKFKEYQQDPENELFRGVSATAEQIRLNKLRQREKAQHNVVHMRTKWRGSGGGASSGPKPLTKTLIAIAILVFLFGGGIDEQTDSTVYGVLSFIDPAKVEGGRAVDGQPLASIQKGEVWRLITPIFLHFGAMHIIFNCLVTYQFAGQIETRWTTLRLGLLVIVLALVSNLCSALLPDWLGGNSLLGGGMSGVLYGLFGYLWMKSLDPQSGVYVSDATKAILLIFLVLCMTPVMAFAHIDNTAHVTGLITGIVLGIAPRLMAPSRL